MAATVASPSISRTSTAGYSAPGQATIKDTKHYGGTFRMPVTNQLSLAAKGDQRIEDQGLETRAIEVDVVYKLTERWSVSTGVRNDFRKDRSPVVPLTQEQGERTDAVAQVMFDPGSIMARLWLRPGYDCVKRRPSETTDASARAAPIVLTKRFRIDAEVSDGDLGFGGKVGTSFLYSERTSLYLNYALENERTDNGPQARRGNLISGAKRRLSDSSSVYFEERYQDQGSLTGLTHATGINLVAKERWNFGASTEFGKLRDSQTGAETNRKATGIRLGYGANAMQLSSAIEYRRDDAEQLDTTHTERTAWLFRNNFKFTLTPDWRVIGKLNYSVSDSSLGEFYAGGYTEAVVGYAYRPVKNDRLNALTKYTYFYNVPTTDQVTLQNTAAEFIQKSHIASFDLTYDLTANWSVGGKYAYRLGQVSLDRQLREFFDNAAQLGGVARGLAVPQGLGEPGRGANARPPGCQSTPPRRADRDLSLHRQEPEGRRRLQLHRLLRRPDRPELRPQRRIRQYHRDQVTPVTGPDRLRFALPADIHGHIS